MLTRKDDVYNYITYKKYILQDSYKKLLTNRKSESVLLGNR